MKKYILMLLLFSSLSHAGSCTVNFSIASYGTIYDQINYSFIPYSSVDPKDTGGGQFFINSNGAWLAATPIAWAKQISVLVSNTSTCDVFYKNGLTNAEVSYANVSGGQSYSSPTTSDSYCLSGTIAAGPGSQTIIVPQFGPNNGYWKPC